MLYGPLSMNNKLTAARIEHLNKVCHIHNANKQFFEIGKVKAFSALDDELRHQQMTQNTANLCKFGLTFKVILQTILPIKKRIQMRRVQSRDPMPRDNVHAYHSQSLHQNPWRKKSFKEPLPPPSPFSKKPTIFIHFLEWYTTLTRR